MRIDVAALEVGQVIRVAFAEPIDSQTEDVVFRNRVTGDVEIARGRRTVRLHGDLKTTTPLSCGRCLTTFTQDLEVRLSEEFLVDLTPDPDGRPGPGELAAGDFILPLGADLVLDVNEAVRQHLLLTLPMVPLCRPDCRGLCPVCGVNRNEVDCGHEPAKVDPRLAPLLEFRDRLPEE